MLFSFAIIASILTVVNVGVNETENTPLSALSTVTKAQAIGYGGTEGQVVQVPSVSGCVGGCSAPKSGGGGGGGVGVTPPKDKIRSNFYSCATVTSSGNCTARGMTVQDTHLGMLQCNMTMYRGDRPIGTGYSAVQYLKARVGGIWNGANDVERMFSHLTGYDIGWAPYPTNWSQVNNFGYNGTTSPFAFGAYSYKCNNVIQKFSPILSDNVQWTCKPKNDGRPFPYAVGYFVRMENKIYNHKNEYLQASSGTRWRQKDWQMTDGTCVYVNKSTPPPMKKSTVLTCYWNIKHAGFYSTNRGSIKSGGTPTTKAPISPRQNAKMPYISGKDSYSKVVNCTQVIDMSATLDLSDGYAYYRLQGSAPFRKYQYYVWDTRYTGGRTMHAKVVQASSGTATRLVYGTHSCAFAQPYRNYATWSSLPALNFDYSECGREKTWQCRITPPKINGVSNNVQVMRNGDYLKVDLGGVRVTGNGVRDFNGKAGKVSDSNLSYMVNVVGGSSPMNGANSNSSKQYFELWKSNKKTETPWGQWVNSPNTNRISYLTFYWSSDNGKTWSMNYKGKLNKVQFAVKVQKTNKSAPTTAWKTETNVDCNGTKTSNRATVLRSVSSEG